MKHVEITATRTDANGVVIIVSLRVESLLYGILTGAGIPCERPRQFKQDKSILEIRREVAAAFHRRRSPLHWVETRVDKGLESLGVHIEKTIIGPANNPGRIRWGFDFHDVIVGSPRKNGRLAKLLVADQRKPDALHQLSDQQIDSRKTRRRNGD
jgi:hypothetical protein